MRRTTFFLLLVCSICQLGISIQKNTVTLKKSTNAKLTSTIKQSTSPSKTTKGSFTSNSNNQTLRAAITVGNEIMSVAVSRIATVVTEQTTTILTTQKTKMITTTRKPINCGPKCGLSCSSGFIKNSSGCSICSYLSCRDAPPCNLTICDLQCEFGFAKDDQGCKTCKCNAMKKCDPVTCDFQCKFGFNTDADGCKVCLCKPNPECPSFECLMFCEFGFQKNDMGCEFCKCNEAPLCPRRSCGNKFCQHGFLVDDNGCATCDCNKLPVCEVISCDLICEFGFAKDRQGCNICWCHEPPVCKPFRCDEFCQFGFVRDIKGCEICQCKIPPVCKLPVCINLCEFGHLEDEFGCQTCACAPPPRCKPPKCLIVCFNGFMKDQNGCEVCACKSDKLPSCSEIICPGGSRCTNIYYGCEKTDPKSCKPTITLGCKATKCKALNCPECKSGAVLDELGCQTCICKNPCEQMRCPFKHKCVIIPNDDLMLEDGQFSNERRAECRKECPKCESCISGSILDEFGCSTCRCKDPCEKNKCSLLQKCVPTPESIQRYKCTPSCVCPGPFLQWQKCTNKVNPCEKGCPKKSLCCVDRNGCSYCHQCPPA